MKKFLALFLAITVLMCTLPLTAMAAPVGDVIELDIPVEVTIENPNDTKDLYFTPTETAYYVFSSQGDLDTQCEIFDENLENLFAGNDDGGTDRNFSAICYMQANTTYCLRVRTYDDETGTFTVSMTKSAVEAIELYDIVVAQGKDSRIETAYNELTDSFDLEWERFIYDAQGYVLFNDGTTQPIENGYLSCSEYEGYINTYDEQSYETPWTVDNTYTAKINIFGVEKTYNVTVVKNPVKALEVNDVQIIEGTNQALDWDDEAQQLYYGYSYCPIFTVTLQDNSTITSDVGNSCIYIGDEEMHISLYDDQSSTNAWDIGPHTVTAKFCGIETTFNVEILETPIESIEVEDVKIIENTNQYNRWDNDTQQEYLAYYYWPEFTVHFKDGTSETQYGSNHIYIGEVQVFVDYIDDQTPTNAWGVGNHTVTAAIGGVETTFNVEIVQNPIESIEVEDIQIIEGTKQSNRQQWLYPGEPPIEYSVYDYYNFVDVKVNFKDGTHKILSGYNLYIELGGTTQYVQFADDQGYDNTWDLGPHTVTASLMGIETTFNVEIIETPIESIEVEDAQIIEGCNISTRWDTDTYEDYYVYYYYPDYTVHFKDGTHQTSIDGSGIDLLGEAYHATFSDNQAADNAWGLGGHTATATLMGVEDTFNVQITETPIESISVEDIGISEGTNGWIREDEYNPDTDQYESWFYYDTNPFVTVEFKDGTSKVIQYGAYLDEDSYAEVWVEDGQNVQNAWGVGTHTVNVKFAGKETSYNVKINDTIVSSLVINDVTADYNLDGFISPNGPTGETVMIGYNPSFKVTLKDGRVFNSVKNTYGEQYVSINGTDHYLNFSDDQEEQPWQLGQHTVTGTLMGVSDQFNVNVVSNYKEISISGTNELKITLTKNNNQTVTYTADRFWGYGYGGIAEGTIFAGDKEFKVNFTCDYDEETGENNYSKDLALTVGTLTSSSINGNKWLGAYINADNIRYTLEWYYSCGKDAYGKAFNKFNGTVNDSNITDIANLAVAMTGYDREYGYVIIGEHQYVILDFDTVEQSIQEVFGVTDVDLTKAVGYDQEEPEKIKILTQNSGGGDDYMTKLSYSGNQWNYEYTPDNRYYYDYNSIKISLNNNYILKSFDFAGSKANLEVVSTTIASLPTKTVYEIDEDFDPTGLKLKETYSDGSEKTFGVSNYQISGFNSLTAGEKTVKVNFKDEILSFKVYVFESANKNFSDTSRNGWYYNAVNFVTASGYFKGYEGTDKFGTADNIQRQDFVIALARLDGVDLEQYDGVTTFADVPQGAYYAKAVQWASENGIVTGYSHNNNFGIGDKITREQLVTILYRYIKNYKNEDVSVSDAAATRYPDYNKVSSFAQDAVIWAIEHNVISGKQDGKYIAPLENAQRCEVAQIIYNAYLNEILHD